MLDAIRLKSITQQGLAALGINEVAYIRQIVVQGEDLFAIMAANGQQIGLAPSFGEAVGAIHDHNLHHAALQ